MPENPDWSGISPIAVDLQLLGIAHGLQQGYFQGFLCHLRQVKAEMPDFTRDFRVRLSCATCLGSGSNVINSASGESASASSRGDLLEEMEGFISIKRNLLDATSRGYRGARGADGGSVCGDALAERHAAGGLEGEGNRAALFRQVDRFGPAFR